MYIPDCHADAPDATQSSDVKPPGDDQATQDGQPRVPEAGSELDRLMVTSQTPLSYARCSRAHAFTFSPMRNPH